MVTEAKDIFEATSKSVRELFCENGLGLYIPAYQRPFGWDKEKVNKLVQDTFHGYIGLSRNDESFTFLGTVITIHDVNYTTVQPVSRPDVPGKVLNVIDGQQRLSTLLIFCIALHDQIRIKRSIYFKNKREDNFNENDSWLETITQQALGDLRSTFVEKRPTGDSPLYPRMIRCFDDQWSNKKLHAKYTSPIAHLINEYSSTLDNERSSEFKASKRPISIEGEEALCDRFNQISKILKSIDTIEDHEDFESLPHLSNIAKDTQFQKALINHDFPLSIQNELTKSDQIPKYGYLLQLVLIANYLLSRVALTSVKGTNEDYAFTIFESLNTTGEPLTAFETFKPQVVMAETLEKFESSESRIHMNKINSYLSTFKVGEPLQKATRELLITFASNESGYTLSKRISDQRKYLKEEYDRHKDDEAQRILFIKNFGQVASFFKYTWDTKINEITLHELPNDATTNSIKLCIAFLISLKHSISIGLIVRFYSAALDSLASERPQRIRDLEAAIKAITAFSALWRAAKRGTSNIDRQYREILLGHKNITNAPAFARTVMKANPNMSGTDINLLKAELRARLKHKDYGDLKSKEDFINQAVLIPAYDNNRSLSRFMLLAAYHDSVADPSRNGLIMKGRPLVSPCLTFEGFNDDRNLTLEHIAPQQSANGWDKSLYADKEIVHRMGNLVLVPKVANSSLSSRPWKHKRVLYRVLGAASHEIAAEVLEKAQSSDGVEFGGSTQELLSTSTHLPHLAALGNRDEDWTVEFINNRSKTLLGLAYDELSKWLD